MWLTIFCLVFIFAGSHENTIIVLRSDGAEQIYAPTIPASAQNPTFSPDGDTILFTIFHGGYNVGPAGLFKISPFDGALYTLIDEPDVDNVNLPGTSWNPVIGKIVFASDREDREEIWTINPDGTNLFRVTHHTSSTNFIEPSFSPDGQWIVFEEITNGDEDEEQGSIWKVRCNGTQLTRLTDGFGGGTDDRQPNWSPTGEKILFQRRVPGSDDWNIYTMSPDGTNMQQVTTQPSSDTDASWSPDGLWIVYSSDYGGLSHPKIFIIPASGGTPIRVTNEPNFEDGAPSWSPNGEWITFESHTTSDENSPSTIWKIPTPNVPVNERRYTEYAVISVFPNPFNSSCYISAPPGTKIEIFALNGECIKSIIHAQQQSDNKACFYIWTPTENVTSGLYLIRAEVGRQKITKQVVLMK